MSFRNTLIYRLNRFFLTIDCQIKVILEKMNKWSCLHSKVLTLGSAFSHSNLITSQNDFTSHLPLKGQMIVPRSSVPLESCQYELTVITEFSKLAKATRISKKLVSSLVRLNMIQSEVAKYNGVDIIIINDLGILLV